MFLINLLLKAQETPISKLFAVTYMEKALMVFTYLRLIKKSLYHFRYFSTSSLNADGAEDVESTYFLYVIRGDYFCKQLKLLLLC